MARFSYGPAAIAAVALLAACGGDNRGKDSALAADSSLNRDLKLAGTDTAAKPQLADVPKAPPTKQKAPVTKQQTKTVAKAPAPTPAPPPAPPKPTTGTIAAGTQLSLKAASEICTNTNKVGDTFTATLNEPVAGSNGATIPAGAVVTFTASKLKRSENTNDPIEMVFAVNSVAFGGKTYAVDGTVTSVAVDKVKNEPKAATAKKVVGEIGRASCRERVCQYV